jgi:di/tricarboxylate transporter
MHKETTGLRDRKLIRLECLIWTVLFCMLVFYILQQKEPLSEAINHAAHSVASYAIIVYGNALWLMPKLYRKGKYFLYSVSIVVLLVALTIIRVQTQTYIYVHWIIKKPFEAQFKDFLYIHYLCCPGFQLAFRLLHFFKMRQQDELLKTYRLAVC